MAHHLAPGESLGEQDADQRPLGVHQAVDHHVGRHRRRHQEEHGEEQRQLLEAAQVLFQRGVGCLLRPGVHIEGTGLCRQRSEAVAEGRVFLAADVVDRGLVGLGQPCHLARQRLPGEHHPEIVRRGDDVLAVACRPDVFGR